VQARAQHGLPGQARQRRAGKRDSTRSEFALACRSASGPTPNNKPLFREAFKRGRCLIPVSGYYEWQDTPDGFTARDGSPALTIAGLWDEWRDRASGETLKSWTMIIGEPNSFVAEVHDRMPVLLGEKDYEPWLSAAAGTELLKPTAEDLLQRWPVSTRVNSSRPTGRRSEAA
jgi:putative SOS response-associated peptidase YedK